MIRLNGNFYTINYPGSTYTLITDVSAAGSVVGTYTDAASFVHGFAAICAANQIPCTQ
jgi:hypothetical protein